MTKQETISFLKAYLDGDTAIGNIISLRSVIESAIEHLSVPEVEGLDEAAEEYAYTNWEDNDYYEGASEGLPFDAIGHTQKCFKAGAQWRDAQILKLPDSVDEAAEEYRYDNFCAGADFTPEYIKSLMEAAFKAGAEWMAGQGYVDEVKYSDLEDRKYVFVPYEEFNPGDKVVVQIRKK